ncbi:MAG TPA: serine/threonine protein kinase, partial [Oceanospirillales bacterium]|nr:serine/threonine protein kinase [Oceanospirillales bacterium]
MKKFGHYEVTAELGRGGMGVVYAGFEPSLNRKVAIKALGEHLINDKDLVERFMREAKATAALNDPNVIQIYFIGEEQGQPYFAMEYIDGQSLDDILKGNKALTVKHAKNILKQACLGLSAAHKKDLVHRDIKPANLMLTTEGVLKVVDFGIARTREYGDKLTNTGEFVGTPGYLSPEVCVGKEVDARSDIFSLGIVFYEMLAGKVPFENDSPLGLMLEVVQSEIPDIRNLNNKVDKKTSFILNKMIAKAPEDRYQSCDEIIRDLGNVITNEKLQNIKQAAHQVQAAKVSKATKKVSQQVTVPSAQAVTAQNLKIQTKGSKKWLVAATLFAVLGAGAFGYVNGYLPFPKHDNSSTTTTALLDNNLASSQQATNDTQSTAQLADISSDTNLENNSQNSSENTTSDSDAKKPGLMAGIGKMFDNDEKDEAVTKDNNKIDFNQNNADDTVKCETQVTQVAAVNQDLTQEIGRA